MRTVHRIGSWRFDPDEPVLRGVDGDRRLEDRAARTLEVLCARRGQVVSKDELIVAVWNGRAVSANSVSIVIGDLRRALGDDPRAPSHILTVAKRGYRLSLEVEPPLSDMIPPLAPAPLPRARWQGAMRAAAVAAAGAGILFVGAVAISPSSRIALLVDATRNDTGRSALDPLAASLDAVVVDRAMRLRDVHVLLHADGPGRSGERRLELRTRLILWNGAPELAMVATDAGTRTVIWSGFAGGAPGNLAGAVADRITAFGSRLRS